MHIVDAQVELLTIPFRRPFSSATGTWQQRDLGLVRLRSNDGDEGLGEIATHHPGGIQGSIPDGLTELMVGLDPADDADLERRLGTVDAWPRVGRALRSAVESASVELLARSGGHSVASMLVAQPRLEVHVNGLLGLGSSEDVASQAGELVAAGFTCLKMKAGSEPLSTIIERIAAVRGAVGSDTSLRLDLNGSLRVAEATELLDAIAAYQLEYVEQPIAAAAGVAELASLRRSSPVRVAADESLRGLSAARELLDAEAADVFVIKPARVGGLRSAWRIAELAATADTPVVVSTMFETGIGVAGALQLAVCLPGDRAHGLATGDLLATDLLVRSLTVERGRMAVPLGVGLGIELDAAAAEGYRR